MVVIRPIATFGTTVASDFTIPSVTDSAVLQVVNGAGFVSGQNLRLEGYDSQFFIEDVTGNDITIRNDGPTFDDEAEVVPTGNKVFQVGAVGPEGPVGPAGPIGPIGGRRITIADFNIPNVNDGITIRIDRLDFTAGQWVFITGFGPVPVDSVGYDVPGGFNFVTVINPGRTDNGTPGTTISTGTVVETIGPPGNVDDIERFINGPANLSGLYREVTGGVWPSNVCWYTDNTKTKKVFEQVYTRNGNQQATTIEHKVYASDGVLVIATATDTITYVNAFESTRTRVIT